ncbi:hypothetical protein CARUB_v10003575mg [Capsella rubella]|uniref:Ubiquitin-like domain-containing protein n=1 Tax=Capsella rubella TaxID=81985 RepID=R0H4R2_9BRAS|nr:ubiquitin domain-containing protein 7SL RNA2 [Capsella rubella]EOA19705.1 hypothetical protein CARUB_v10003575mg [Capsella rubella]
MKLLIDTASGASFPIDVEIYDSLKRIKEKIEEFQGIPVCKQTLFLNGQVLPEDFILRFHIMPKSFFLSTSPDENPNQDNNNSDQVPQTEQAPSDPNHGFFNNQDLPVMSNKYQVSTPYGHPMTLNSMEAFLGFQEINQALYHTEQTSASLESFGETSSGGDRALMTDLFSKNDQHDLPEPFPRIMARGIDNGASEQSYTLDDIFVPEDLPYMPVGSKRNRDQPEKASSSNSVNEVINIPDSPEEKKMKTSPEKLVVIVSQQFEDNWLPVVVNADDNVEELRKELDDMKAKGQFNLPSEGYFFVHNEKPLRENTSFLGNGIADGDTIAIYPDLFVDHQA